MAKCSQVLRTLSCEGEEIQRNPIFWINANTNHIHLVGFGRVHQNLKEVALPYLNLKEKKIVTREVLSLEPFPKASKT